MKRIFMFLMLALYAFQHKAQPTATVAIQYFIDANSNCTYDGGEQLLYNIATSYSYMTNASTVAINAVPTASMGACGASTLYLWNAQLSPANNTFMPTQAGVVPVAGCGSYTNLAYNSNSIVMFPVTVAPGVAIGGTVFSFICGAGPAAGNNTVPINNGTVGLCSNIGNDSLAISFNLANVFGCSNSSSVAPRTYSLFLDGVLFDSFTLSNALNTFTNATSSLNQSKMNEFYTSTQAYITVSPKLPSTFTVLGSHTLAIKSGTIYTNSQSYLDFSCVLNSVPCSKVTGYFYNDCNNNCLFDGPDTYGVGNYATGMLYNSANNFSITFHPNQFDGKYSVYLPTNLAYTLSQYPSTWSPTIASSFTPCVTNNIIVPAGGGTYTYTFGYKNNLPVLVDPSVYIYRINSTSPIISPLVGIHFGVTLSNSWWNICNASGANPGKLKVTLPKFINYLNTVSGITPTLVSGPTLDTLIYAVPNFSNVGNWWSNAYTSFSAAVNLTAVANTQFTINARITPATDINLSNNSYNFIRTIAGPFDPNGKWTEVNGLQANGDVPYGTTEFIYKIGFQNIGDAPAINVKTSDTIDQNFDLSSIRVLQSSFPVSLQTDLQSREVLFHFNGILLPAASVNEPGSHGFVRYSIKLKPGVPVNTILKNRAHNYFDFNEAVATNQTSNKLVLAVALNELGEQDQRLQVMPNPFKDALRLVSDQEMSTIVVYNLVGKELKRFELNGKVADLDLSEQASGLYLIRVGYSGEKFSTIKVVKH